MNTKITLSHHHKTLEVLSQIETDHLLILQDTNVTDIDLSTIKLKKTFYRCQGGEDCKSFQSYEKCASFFLKEGAHRKSHLLVVGGGSMSDLGGFVAATLMRGVPWSVIPTTLLSMVDASIGGKTAINTDEGKNLLGTFHLPDNVLLDTNYLKTLDEEEFKSGLGEVLKYCFLSPEINELVWNRKNLQDIVYTCAQYKNDIVVKDYKESGLRKLLNLGHTFGHAIEKEHHLKHGEAIAWGLLMIIKLYGEEELLKQAKELLSRLSLSLNSNIVIDGQRLMNYIKNDKKKVSNNEIELVIPGKDKSFLVKKKIKEIALDLKSLQGMLLNDLL